MKSLVNIFIGFMAVAYLSSCENPEPITDYRGQVKFETISVSNKLAGRVSKIYVQEGQTVKQGDTLAAIYIPEVNAKMMQTELFKQLKKYDEPGLKAKQPFITE